MMAIGHLSSNMRVVRLVVVDKYLAGISFLETDNLLCIVLSTKKDDAPFDQEALAG